MWNFLFGRHSKPVSIAANGAARSWRAKLRLEHLEVREVPATLTWLGVHTDPDDFYHGDNWYNQEGGTGDSPTEGDDLYFLGVPSPNAPPTPPGEMPLLPSTLPANSNPNADATIPDDLLALPSLHLMRNYTGNVSTPDNLSVGTLDLHTGASRSATPATV